MFLIIIKMKGLSGKLYKKEVPLLSIVASPQYQLSSVSLTKKTSTPSSREHQNKKKHTLPTI